MRGDVLRAGMCAGSALLMVMASFAPVPTQGGWPNKAGSSVTKLADSIDKLEMHIEQYGSVVPKQPDVWGQARMTKYRRMVEDLLEGQKGEFKTTINATISRSDQASFVNTLALQAAISGPQSIITKRRGTTVVNNPASGGNAAAAAATEDDPPSAIGIPPIPATPDVSAQAFGSTLANSRGVVPFAKASDGIALEPTVMLDQLTTYLNHLNQLRRTNEGDDTADAPGYALHLVRIPVSVLPGKKTQQGYGAEITFTAEPVINENLLPTVFRSLVSNDVIDISAATMHDLLISEFDPNEVPDANLSDAELGSILEDHVKVTPDVDPSIKKAPNENIASYGARLRTNSYVQSDRDVNIRIQTTKEGNAQKVYNYVKTKCMAPGGNAAVNAQSLGAKGPTLNAQDIFSGQMLVSLYNLAKQTSNSTADGESAKSELILDLRKTAGRQVQGAYAMISEISSQELSTFVTRELLAGIRNQNKKYVNSCRDEFVAKLQQISGASLSERNDAVVAMAWTIVYESALLNAQLLDDMKMVAVDNGGSCYPGEEWVEFFQPRPGPGVPELFGNYVRARWPIHVFAIDPMTSDQNVADTFSRKRDMQLSLSLAFTSGAISAQNFTRFARRLELDMESIALNRTQVGFSHGDDTFGWRFYPRVQSPPIDSNAKVFFRDLLVGGPSRSCDLNTMRLEPGARECVALIIMPSFVPYVRFDTRTNWFKLSNPKQKEFDLKQDVELGTAVTCLREASASCQQDNCVRGTDLALLMRSVDQLEHRLPLQTCMAQVPFELTDSGHTVFNHGVTDLAPRLRGYYGEPGKKETEISVAVVGENFSVSETQVIAGNIRLSTNQIQLLSRQVMIITIPKEALSANDSIDVHVATPYGVSNHLDIKLPKSKPGPTPSDWQLSKNSATCTYVVDTSKRDDEAGYFNCVSYTPAVIAQYKEAGVVAGTAMIQVKFEFDDLGPFTVNARAVTPGYTIDIRSLAQGLLDNLILNHQIDTAVPPESATYKLTDIEVVGGGPLGKIDGDLTLTFKRRPTDIPATPAKAKRTLQQQQQQLQIKLPKGGRKPPQAKQQQQQPQQQQQQQLPEEKQQNEQPAVPAIPVPGQAPDQSSAFDSVPRFKISASKSTGFEVQE